MAAYKLEQEKQRAIRMAQNNIETERELIKERTEFEQRRRDFNQTKMLQEAKFDTRAARIEQDKQDFAEEKAR